MSIADRVGEYVDSVCGKMRSYGFCGCLGFVWTRD